MEKDPKKRLGYKNGASDILKHSWFKGVSLSEVENRLIPSFEAYLKQTPKESSESVSETTKEKMEVFNLRYQKIVKKLLSE